MRIGCWLVCAAFAARVWAQPVTAITGAMVVDGTGSGPRALTVLVQGERIMAVGAADIPAGAKVVDARGYTLIPGLFDLHTHLSTANAGGISADWSKHLAAYLLCGVTTVADLGSYGEQFAPRRELLTSGQVQGPNVAMAYRLTTPGGHGAEAGRPDIFSLEVVSPEDAKAAVKRAAAYKPDLIKIFTDGWRYGRGVDMTSMDVATLKAAVEEAHAHHLPVITHTVTLARAKDLARAGVDLQGHAIQDLPVDEELISLFKQSGIIYTPTMAIYEPRDRDMLSPILAALIEPAAMKLITPPLTPGEGTTQRSARFDVLKANVTALHRAGIPIAVGTDAGGAISTTFHGWATWRELELLVSAGLTPIEAIKAATSTSARGLKVDADRGTIAPGKRADLVLVKGEPFRDIREIQKVERVWRSGREMDLAALKALIALPGMAPLTAVKAPVKPMGHWENQTDSGHDHTKMLFTATTDGARHPVTLVARMSEKAHPRAVLRLPLQPGNVVPVDASGFKGVRFDVRGDGKYTLVTPTRGVRDSRYYQAEFKADGKWHTVKVPFTSLQQRGESKTPVAWTGKDLLSLEFETERPAGQGAWLEVDKVEFYK